MGHLTPLVCWAALTNPRSGATGHCHPALLLALRCAGVRAWTEFGIWSRYCLTLGLSG